MSEAVLIKLIPLEPTVRELLLFHTGAPLLVVQYGASKWLLGRYCSIKYNCKMRLLINSLLLKNHDKRTEEDYNEHHLVWVHREYASSCKTRYLQMSMI